MAQIFLPWHRWYLLEFENFLRQIDCRITISYLDWSMDSEHWARGTEKSDVWSPMPHSLGGDGQLPQGCVTDGPFKEGIFYFPETIGYGCLKRNFNLSCFPPSKDQIENAINNSSFTVFEKFIGDKIHPSFHDCVDGQMLKHHSASFTPEFWIHHSFVDKLWTAWQTKNYKQKFEYFTSISFEMPLTERYPGELLDNDGLAGDVRVSYEHIGGDSDKRKRLSRLDAKTQNLKPHRRCCVKSHFILISHKPFKGTIFLPCLPRSVNKWIRGKVAIDFS